MTYEQSPQNNRDRQAWRRRALISVAAVVALNSCLGSGAGDSPAPEGSSVSLPSANKTLGPTPLPVATNEVRVTIEPDTISTPEDIKHSPESASEYVSRINEFVDINQEIQGVSVVQLTVVGGDGQSYVKSSKIRELHVSDYAGEIDPPQGYIDRVVQGDRQSFGSSDKYTNLFAGHVRYGVDKATGLGVGDVFSYTDRAVIGDVVIVQTEQDEYAVYRISQVQTIKAEDISATDSVWESTDISRPAPVVLVTCINENGTFSKRSVMTGEYIGAGAKEDISRMIDLSERYSPGTYLEDGIYS